MGLLDVEVGEGGREGCSKPALVIFGWPAAAVATMTVRRDDDEGRVIRGRMVAQPSVMSRGAGTRTPRRGRERPGG